MGSVPHHLTTLMKLVACCIALLVAWSSPLLAHTDEEVKKFVSDYFAANQIQDWKKVVAMYHPETLVEIQTGILLAAKIPETSAEVNDDNRAAVTEMLQALEVKTPEEIWALPPAAFYERMLDLGRKKNIGAGLKDVKTTIKSIKVEKEGDEFHADADIESVLRGKLYSGVTHFIIEPVEGQLKVVAMTKTKNEPRDIEDKDGDKKREAPEVEPVPGGKPE
jgi:hypothetical protein